MKMLQREFDGIMTSLKPSLQHGMKFEIAERLIYASDSFDYLRLHWIQTFVKKRS